MTYEQSEHTRTLALLPLRHGVLFPNTVISVPVGRDRSIALVESIKEGDSVVIAVQRDPEIDDPGIAELFPIATRAVVRKLVKVRQRRYQLVIEGQERCRLITLHAAHPYWRAEVEPVTETGGDQPEPRALVESLVERLGKLGKGNREFERRIAQARGRAPGAFADIVAGALDLSADKEIPLLLELDVPERLRRLYACLLEAEAFAEIKSKIDREVHKELGKQQREILLRQQLQAIQKELGDDDEEGAGKLREKLAAMDLPEETRKTVDRELRRLARMSPAQPEHHVIVSYLELIADLPWDKRADAHDDISAVEEHLDGDHYGLDEVKKRILEHLAVRKVTGGQRGAILCMAGPPGVGKTSLASSIAEATGRPFVRVSLGGVRDEAEIRGHRRTYIGAMPGRIVRAMTQAGVKNPIILLDEIDKLMQGWAGSPEAALLEVLDPEQNHTFTDHYLEMPFDLSEVLFICTANTLDTLSPPLRDRLEIVELEGYTMQEKQHIARRHLLPKQLERHGLTEDVVHISDAALNGVIQAYTREAGVRQLDRELTKICRAVTLESARQPEGKSAPTRIDDDDALAKYLGKPRFFEEMAERMAIPGVATGLAWTPVGGDILFIESSRMPGQGKLETTGQLGDVMKESARAALTYVRSHADELGVDADFLEKQDLHVHVPAGGTPKDGPSAGVTIFTALTSLLTGRRVRSDTAMTGECTLRGRVLPVGGIKSKVLAASRAGITRVILPEKNRRDLDEVPEEVRDCTEFIFAEDMSQVLDAALEGAVFDAPTTIGGRQPRVA